MRLPELKLMQEVDPDEDPLKYYRMPGVGWFYLKRLRLALDLVPDERYDRLLDLGYGSGILLPELAARSRAVVAVDKHGREDVVTGLLARERLTGTRLLRGNLLTLPFADGSFDALVCLSVLEHIRDTTAGLRELRRVLRPGGRLLVGFPVENWFTDLLFRLIGADTKTYHVARYDRILAGLEELFTVERIAGFPPLVPRGAGLYLAAAARKP